MLFHRPFKVKSNVLLRSSDRKRIKTLILTQFPQIAEEILDKVYCKEIYSLKIETYNEDTVIVYSAYKLPLIFEYDNVIYPTIYLSWLEPDVLPSFTTHEDVLKFIRGGADLMLPGIIIKNAHSKKNFGNFKKGDRVLINTSTNRAGVAVGDTCRSSEDLFMSGGKGKAVEILHYWGDELCKMSIEIDYPQLGKPDVCKTPEEFQRENEERLTMEFLRKELADQTISEGVPNVDGESNVANDNNIIFIKTEDTTAEVNEEVIDNENTPEFMDDLFIYSFTKAIKTGHKKIELPMLASNFNKVHMIPACPCGYQLDIKKSTFKKLSNFLNHMEKTHNIIRLETNAGVLKITAINLSNELLKNFVDKYQDSGAQPVANSTNEKDSKKKKVDVVEHYNVTAAVLPLFSEFLCKKGDALHMKDIKKYIVEYVNKYKLQDPENKTIVHLNETLKIMILSKTTPDDLILTYEQLIKEIIAKMTQSFQVLLSNDQISQYKGKLKPIDLQIATRSGNKKVTLINNLDVYGINLKEFCKLCQHGVAASATINIINNNQQQVQVQGNQIIFVYNLLTEKYTIQKRFIRGLEFADKKKKK